MKHLNMDLLLEKFVTHFSDLYGDYPDQFKEEDGRRFFLLYLKPIINGTGNSAHGISGTLSFKERIYAELQF